MVEGWRNREQDAARLIFSRYEKLVRSVVNDRLNMRYRSRVDIDDITQMVFAIIFKELQNRTFESEQQLQGRICAIARNVTISEVKFNESKRRNINEEQAYDFSSPAAAIGLHKQCADRDTTTNRLAQLDRALPELGVAERELLDMLYFQNLPQSVVAKRLGITTRQVRRRRSSAILRLQSILY